MSNPSDDEIRRVEAWQKAQRDDEIQLRREEAARKKAEAEARVASLFVGKTVERVKFTGDRVDWAGDSMAEVYEMEVHFTDGSYVEIHGDYESRLVSLGYPPPKAADSPTEGGEDG